MNKKSVPLFINYYHYLFFDFINLIVFRIDGIVTIVSATITIKSKCKFDTPNPISYLYSWIVVGMKHIIILILSRLLIQEYIFHGLLQIKTYLMVLHKFHPCDLSSHYYPYNDKQLIFLLFHICFIISSTLLPIFSLVGIHKI